MMFDFTESIEAARTGDLQAFETIYAQSAGKFRSVIRAKLNREQDVDDILQETFINIFKSLDKINEPKAFIAWGCRVAENATVDFIRKKEVHEGKDVLTAPIVDEDEYGMEDTPLTADNFKYDPGERIEEQVTNELILSILNQIPEEQKICLLMSNKGLKYREIAEELGITENTVKSRIRLGKGKLKTLIEAFEEKNGIKLHAKEPVAVFVWMLLLYDMRPGVVQSSKAAHAYIESIKDQILDADPTTGIKSDNISSAEEGKFSADPQNESIDPSQRIGAGRNDDGFAKAHSNEGEINAKDNMSLTEESIGRLDGGLGKDLLYNDPVSGTAGTSFFQSMLFKILLCVGVAVLSGSITYGVLKAREKASTSSDIAVVSETTEESVEEPVSVSSIPAADEPTEEIVAENTEEIQEDVEQSASESSAESADIRSLTAVEYNGEMCTVEFNAEQKTMTFHMENVPADDAPPYIISFSYPEDLTALNNTILTGRHGSLLPICTSPYFRNGDIEHILYAFQDGMISQDLTISNGFVTHISETMNNQYRNNWKGDVDIEYDDAGYVTRMQSEEMSAFDSVTTVNGFIEFQYDSDGRIVSYYCESFNGHGYPGDAGSSGTYEISYDTLPEEIQIFHTFIGGAENGRDTKILSCSDGMITESEIHELSVIYDQRKYSYSSDTITYSDADGTVKSTCYYGEMPQIPEEPQTTSEPQVYTLSELGEMVCNYYMDLEGVTRDQIAWDNWEENNGNGCDYVIDLLWNRSDHLTTIMDIDMNEDGHGVVSYVAEYMMQNPVSVGTEIDFTQFR